MFATDDWGKAYSLAIAFSLSQIVLSALLLWRQQRWSTQERIFGVLLFCVAAYLLDPLVGPGAWSWLTISLQTAVPGLFWLFSASLFDDHFRLHKWQIAVVAATVLLPLFGSLLQSVAIAGPELLLFTLPQAMEFVLVGLTLFAVARHWRVDLVESRRRLRLWFCALNGLYIFTLIFVREVVFPGFEGLANWQYLPIGGLLLATNAILLEFKPGVLKPRSGPSQSRRGAYPVAGSESSAASQVAAAAVTSQPASRVPSALLDEIEHLMAGEAVYREMGLTIGQLAARLGVPEYRLRQAINRELGYRNFNDFLNIWRVREAARRLVSPEEMSLPILTIAMDCGFRSLSSFNKAFREQQGVTPTAYRRAQCQR